MSERLQNKNRLTRRTVLKSAGSLGLALGASAALSNVRWLAEKTGETIDARLPLERIVDYPIPVLEPRINNAPVVDPLPRGEAQTIQTNFLQQGDTTVFSFDSDTPLWSEHTDKPISNEDFSPAGTAIITTVEGLVKGEQEYCTLFKGTSQTVAVGYEGGIYAFEPALGTPGESRGEWVRVVTKDPESTLPSPARTEWRDPDMRHGMLIEKVAKGTQTLQDLGYRPWAAILPSARMPEMTQKELDAHKCAQTIEEITDPRHKKEQFVSKKGDIIDIGHMRDKASGTFDLYMQLLYLRATGQSEPVAGVRYSTEDDVWFEFATDQASLRPENLGDTAFSMMCRTTMLMEGVTQRYIFEKAPAVDTLLPDQGGLSAEDPFSNSLGIVGMLSLIREHGLTDKFEKHIKALHRDNPHMTAADMRILLEESTKAQRQILADHVVAGTAHNLGVRPQNLPATYQLPRGMYPLIPAKVTDEDAATPTTINLRAAGIRPNNPQVHVQPVTVPAMEPTLDRLFKQLGF